MARAALKWGVRELAARAQVSPNTVTRIEKDKDANAATLQALERALTEGGVEFLEGGSVRFGPNAYVERRHNPVPPELKAKPERK
jgi:transcriptional regulator with XRE-family HTH domain